MKSWNDDDWLEGVRRWYYGGLPPAGDGPSVHASAAAAGRESPDATDAYGAMIEAACEAASRERRHAAAQP